jgi:putative permease
MKEIKAPSETIATPFFTNLVKRFLPNSQAGALALILLIGFLSIYYLSDILMPVLVAVVIAYLMEGIIIKAENCKIPRFIAVTLVFCVFMAGLIFLLFVLMPILYEQTLQLIQHTPAMIRSVQKEILRLPEIYPQFISEDKLKSILYSSQKEILKYTQQLLSFSAASVINMVTAMVYLILVPMLVFFFIKDKHYLVDWVGQFMPKDRHLSLQVWQEVDGQIGNYVRGKFVEVLILGVASYITFSLLGLNYAMLLAVFMGLQAMIPYVGATLVTFPVIAVAYFQWGMSADQFMYVSIAYAIIQAIDGVVLVPLLFSEAVNLHPIAIIVAILFFGGLWGIWGVFFAIPLATLVKAVINAWPRKSEEKQKSELII